LCALPARVVLSFAPAKADITQSILELCSAPSMPRRCAPTAH